YREASAKSPSTAALPALQLHLSGNLGAGKTALVRATLRALGHTGRVRSPTYTLVEPYTITIHNTSVDVYLFDLYRFADRPEWMADGFRYSFPAASVCFIEWPEQVGELPGLPDLALTLHTLDTGRRLNARAYSGIGKECLEQC